MQTTQTGLKNFGRAVFHGVAILLILFGANLVHLIPANIATMSVGGFATFLITWFTQSVTTPAGSTVVHPVV